MGRIRRAWKPSKPMFTTANSPAWQSNVNMAMEASAVARYEIANLIVKVEISRQLDRIANALEKKDT